MQNARNTYILDRDAGYSVLQAKSSWNQHYSSYLSVGKGK